MTPGATYHGEVCTYVETWSAPENDVSALLAYQTMFQEYLFNITNTTLFNFSIAASTAGEFALRRDLLYPERAEQVAAMAANLSAAMHAQAGTGRRLADGLEPIYPAKTPEPGQAPEDIDYWERGRRVINRDIYGHDRKTGIRTDPAPAHGPTVMPLSFPPPLQQPIDWRSSAVADFAKLFEKRLVEHPLNATWAQHRHRAIDCAGPPAARRRLDDVPVNFSAYPTALFTITSEFLMSSERAREAVLTLTTWHAMRDLLAPFDLVPCRDRLVRVPQHPGIRPRALAASAERLGEPKITSNLHTHTRTLQFCAAHIVRANAHPTTRKDRRQFGQLGFWRKCNARFAVIL